jgi:DNA replication protein DnaC
VAGNQTHEIMLRQRFPDAVSAECDGDGNFATIRLPGDGEPMHGPCPGCQADKFTAALGAFVPPRFTNPIPLPEAAAEWAARGREAQGLYLCGPVGTGKTHTAWSAVAAWCAAADVVPHEGGRAEDYMGGGHRSPSVVFARMVDLLDDFRPGDDSLRRVRDCQRAKLLVIDDLGAEKASEWTQERLYSVVDHRYANCLPLLVTGNMPPRQLADQTGDRVASRLAEMCEVVPMTGADRRRPGA